MPQEHTAPDAPAVPAWAPHLPPGVGVDGLADRLLARRSLPAAWAATWASAPSRPVLCEAGSPWLSAGELEARSAVVAGRLRRAGLEPGDRVLVSAAPSVDLVVAHAGALRAGLVVVPANTGYRREEIGHLVADSEPRAALTDDPERARWCTEARPGTPMLLAGPEVDLPDGPRPALDDEVVGPDSPALIGYTSGTTGRPKGAVLSHGNLLASVEALLLAWRWSPDDRLVLALPLFHMHGLGVGVHGTLAAGGSAVLLGRFDVDAVLDAAADQQASLFFGVPTMYERLVASPRARELGRLRLCVSGSAPMPADLHHRFEAASGQRALERYGMTETVMLVSNPYDGERRAGTVGLPLARRRPPAVTRPRGGAGAGTERVRRLPQPARGERDRVRRWRLVPHRRSRRARRGRLPEAGGPGEGADHLGRLQRVPA